LGAASVPSSDSRRESVETLRAPTRCGFCASGECNMTGPDPDPDDPYRYTDHPLLDLPAEPPSDLLTEMTTIIDKLCRHPRYSEADLPIAFRQVQKRPQTHQRGVC